jgi:hypothetical protein
MTMARRWPTVMTNRAGITVSSGLSPMAPFFANPPGSPTRMHGETGEMCSGRPPGWPAADQDTQARQALNRCASWRFRELWFAKAQGLTTGASNAALSSLAVVTRLCFILGLLQKPPLIKVLRRDALKAGGRRAITCLLLVPEVLPPHRDRREHDGLGGHPQETAAGLDCK